MSPPDPVWLAIKLARGVKHLDNISQEVNTLVASDACGIIPDFNSEPGFLVVKAYMRETPSPLCSVYVGEALYQLSVSSRSSCVSPDRKQRPGRDQQDRVSDLPSAG